jgi:hypothetical protein
MHACAVLYRSEPPAKRDRSDEDPIVVRSDKTAGRGGYKEEPFVFIDPNTDEMWKAIK